MASMMAKAAILAGAAAAALVLGVGGAAGAGQHSQEVGDSRDMPAREEFRQTYRIAPDGTVRVRGIAGPVSVETIDGGDTAEVYILRMAATERELRCYRTDVRSSPDRLSIEHVQDEHDQECNRIRSRQQVRLRVPRSVNLDFATVAGALDVAPIDGMVRLEAIAGATALAGVRTAEIDAIAGPLSIGLAGGGQDVRISSVVGPVELNLARGVDADLHVDSVIGSVRSLASDLEMVNEDGSYRARIGAGGGSVRLSSVVGSVELRRP